MIHFAGVVCVWGGEPTRVYSQEPHYRESSKRFWCPFFPSPTLPPQSMHSRYSPLLLPVFFHLSSPSQVKVSTRSHFSLLNARILFLHSLLFLCTSYSGDIRVRRRGSRWDCKKIHQRHLCILAVIKPLYLFSLVPFLHLLCNSHSAITSVPYILYVDISKQASS